MIMRASVWFDEASLEGDVATSATTRVTIGHAWITMEGDARDHVLTSNEEREFAGPGLLVIEGLEQGARIQFGNPF
jgi:hypothetical protein